jgi:hypothetical protein
VTTRAEPNDKESTVIRKRTISMLAAVILAALFAGAASAALSHLSPSPASVVIRHQTRGCHSWSVNGSPFAAAQKIVLKVGASLKVTNDDVMPHQLVQTSGPKVIVPARARLAHMGAFTTVTFAHKGVYLFTTRAGEDYMKGVKTIGEDNILRLKVTVA